jgi:hypothetical protein
MRFFKRESTLEILQRQLSIIDKQASELKASLEALRGNGLIDPVLRKFLEEHCGFDYGLEREKLEMVVRQKEAQLAELEGEKKKLEPQLQEEAFQQRLRDMQIYFDGADVEGSIGSIVKVKCSHCGHRFDKDLRSHGSFQNVWLCSTDVAKQQIEAMKFNRVWPFQCEKCKAELDVWVRRDKL